MIKLKIALICLFFLASCNSNKSVVRTSKATTSTTKPNVIRNKKVVTTSNQKPVLATQKPNADNKVESRTETLEATSKVKVTTEIVLKYVDSYKDVAIKNMQLHGVPASIALAQAILESGAGTGNLSQRANNHFGIKCHKDWVGDSVSHDDDELQECFRKYKTVLDSYEDYAAFLRGRKWYEPLFKLQKDDYVGWANGLKKAGYATDPKYPSKLIGLIERYQLQKYDAEALGTQFDSTKSVAIKSEENNVSTRNTHEVAKGDTLYSISKRYNISIDDLKKKNNISNNDIAIGQFLQIK